MPLTLSGVPRGAASLVLIVHDPDAPRQGPGEGSPGGTSGGIASGFTHWVAFDADPVSVDFTKAVQGSNDAGKSGYIGPCPPSGTHHYAFTVFALDARLGLPAGATESDVRAAMEGHVLGQTRLTGTYSR